MTIFLIFICIIAILFLVLNLFLAPHNNYAEKMSAFECGFHSFLQTRLPFNISFFIYGILFLLFDLEILLLFPYAVSGNTNNIYGLTVMLIFTLIVTIGFVFEIGKGALKIGSKQNYQINMPKNNIIERIGFIGSKRYYSTNLPL